MSFTDCTTEDLRIIGECLAAAVDGPFFPEWEFATLFGLDRAEVARIRALWPNVDRKDERVLLAINNALGNLVGYPHGGEQQWPRFISVSPTQVLEVLQRWRAPVSARG